jgi:hypothetical protein
LKEKIRRVSKNERKKGERKKEKGGEVERKKEKSSN